MKDLESSWSLKLSNQKVVTFSSRDCCLCHAGVLPVTGANDDLIRFHSVDICSALNARCKPVS